MLPNPKQLNRQAVRLLLTHLGYFLSMYSEALARARR